MEILGFILVGVGSIISLVFSIIILVKAFQTSIWWGLGSIFIPFVQLIFIIMYWDIAKAPFLKMLIGVGIAIVGMVILVTSGAIQAA